MTGAFKDRTEAGERLAGEIVGLGLRNPVVFALPRGGVPVAVPVAKALAAPLDLLMVRKIGAPGQEELAMGAVVDGHDPDVVWNPDIVSALRLTEAEKRAAVSEKLAEIEARRHRYLGDRAPIPVQGRDAVVVDDGIATGATMRAALIALRRRAPASVTLAVPVAPQDSLDRMEAEADRVVCLETPRHFLAVGAHYLDFRQTTDDEVVAAFAALDDRKDTHS